MRARSLDLPQPQPSHQAPPPLQQALPSHAAMEQAAGWFSLLQSGASTGADRARWQDWLASADENRAAWAFVERVSGRFQPVKADPSPRHAADALQTAARRLARRRTVLGLAAVAGLGGLTAWTLGTRTSALDAVLVWGADYRTRTGEQRDVRLADGSRVWLGSDSAFDYEDRADLRRVRLRNGEIFIETAGDSARPFLVDTAQGRLLALGTRFNVRLDDTQGTRLAVFEGAVKVTLADDTGSVVVGAGQQVRLTARQLEPVLAADPAREAWPRGILLAQDITLQAVVAELARHTRGHLAVAPDVAGLAVLGSFPLNDVDGALTMLQQALPIQVRRPLPWWTTIEARPRP